MVNYDQEVPVRWLDTYTPERLPAGASFGVPIPRGAVLDPEKISVVGEGGTPVASQAWSLAKWPDGSLKWAGIALGCTDRPLDSYQVRMDSYPVRTQKSGTFPQAPTHPGELLECGESANLENRVDVSLSRDQVHVNTGPMQVAIPATGTDIIASVHLGTKLIATNGRLVSGRQKHPEPAHHDRVFASSHVTEVEVEQNGPVRAVVTVKGTHRDSERSWLPFTVRLIFSAGARTFRMVHTFTYDGDPEQDFLAFLGVEFRVPMSAPLYDRHVRFVGSNGGVLGEAVQGITGLRRDPGAEVRSAQVYGRATPPLAKWGGGVANLLKWVPSWPDYSLRQLGPTAFSIGKRTSTNHPWIDVAHGDRASGYTYLGSPAGGLGAGVMDFWQSYPSGVDVRGADSEQPFLTLWLWSPDAPPMDLRFYHDGLGQENYADQLEALDITYEDYEPGFGSAHGIARTHELEFYAYANTPDHSTLSRDAAHAAARPRLVPTPEALSQARAFGDWDVEDRSSPEREVVEDRLAALADFYLGQVEERSWYGFWNYGDLMHSYDHDRHTWKYDIGGFAWDNSELATDLWLWTTFLRTGRADVFRFAEAMARHTGDVDVYHAGPHRGLGSRHNVQHWGCSAKQLRIGSPIFRRPHYLLTGDERSRDLLLELRHSDEALAVLEPTRKLHGTDTAASIDRRRVLVGLGTDWGALAAAWLANWEISGDTYSRDRLLGTMADIAGFPHGFFHGQARYDLEAGRFTEPECGISVSHLSAIFGLVEICAELIETVDVPGFERAWLQYCRLYLASSESQISELGQPLKGNNFPQWHSRLLAYAANRLGDREAAERAWEAYREGGQHTPLVLEPIQEVLPPYVLQPVTETQISTNDAAQSSLAGIQNLALIGWSQR